MLKVVSIAALTFTLAFSVSGACFAQTEERANAPLMGMADNSPHGVEDQTRGTGKGEGAHNQGLIDQAIYYDRQLLTEVKKALKRTDISDSDRAALKAKKTELESDIINLQQE